LLIALFLIPDKSGKEPKPFVARLVTPEEFAEKGIPEVKKPGRERQDKNTRESRNNRIRSMEKEAPRVLSSIPKSPSAKKAPLGPKALTKELPSRGGSTRPLPDVAGEKGYKEGSEKANAGKFTVPGRPEAPMRERLFDRDVIAKFSHKDQEGTKKGSPVTFDTTEYKYYGYMQRLREKIEGVWVYPREAAAKGIYGDLYVQFTIKRNGELGAVELQRTSGYKILDDAALKALRDAAPYWSLDNVGENSLTIPAHFIYVNGNYYLR
jgi:periplasmic protein TonB